MIFSVTRDTFRRELKRKLQQVERPRTVIEARAKAVQVTIKKHLRGLQARGNERGWPSQGFFAGSKNSVEKKVGIGKLTDKGALITIADPRFVHRIEGGTVTPKRARRYECLLEDRVGDLSFNAEADLMIVLRRTRPSVFVSRSSRLRYWVQSSMTIPALNIIRTSRSILASSLLNGALIAAV